MLRFLIVAALLLLTPLAASAQRETSHDDPQGKELHYFKRPQSDRVPLLMAGGATMEVREVVVRLGDEALRVSTESGVDWRNEDRVRLRGVPILGRLFFDRFSQDDLSPRKEVGHVYRDGETLSAHLHRGEPKHPVIEVVILNQDKAWFLKGTPQPMRLEGQPFVQYAGKAYIKDGTTLVLLIEPSVITHNLLDRLF